MDKLVSHIKNNAAEYGSIPFWSWNDDLDPAHLIEQINDMHDIGIKGFFMHARSGLETEYLSDKWYECIKACVKRAKELGMEAWAYDENGWPSGFAGGKLLEDPANYSLYLKYEVKDYYDPEAFAVYVMVNGKPMMVGGAFDDKTEYHTIYRRADDSYVDTMDASITRKFIEATHEQYKKLLGDDFGKIMPGFFTDEPQYYRWATVWSDTLPAEFKKRFGYDVMSGLPALFIDYEGAEEFRYDYHLICHELFLYNFVKVLYDWCEENGVKLTGHFVEEKCLHGQMWCCGGVMPMYEYQQYPGMDNLGKVTENDYSAKQLGSVAAQLGKKRVLSEMFACCGWEVTPLELKRTAEHMYYGGVNLMCQHLYPYSERGQRKRDYPAHFSEHNSYYREFAPFNEYFNRLGCALSYGKEKANVLVIHPMHSAYLNYKREIDAPTIAELDVSLQRLHDCMSQNQIAFHYGDEIIMQKHARVEGAKIIVGECEYDTVVLPLIYTIDSYTAKLLKEFLENGGKLANYADTLPTRIDGRIADLSWLKPNISMADVAASSDVIARIDGKEALHVRVMERITDEGRMFYVFNFDKKPLNRVSFTVKNCGHLVSLDLETLEYKAIRGEKNADGSFTAVMDFEPNQSFIILDKEVKAEPAPEARPFTIKNIKLLEIPENAMPLDYAEISYDGVNYGKLSPFMQIKDNLLSDRYKGMIWIKFRFDVLSMPETLLCVVEPLDYKSLTLNGHQLTDVKGYRIDRTFKAYDALPYVKAGENELVMSLDYWQSDYVYHVLYGGVSESLRNCLNFDTEIEIPYLFGKFCVKTDGKFEDIYHEYNIYDGGFAIEAPHEPTDRYNVVKGGYTFFNGYFDLEIERENDGTVLELPGSYPTALVRVNGEIAGRLMFTRKIDLRDYLRSPDDRITVRIWATNRNLLGPHHFIEAECYATPEKFCFEKGWNGDKCEYYLPTYSFKRFGLDV